MSYPIVPRDPLLIGGLVVPRVRPSFKVSSSDLIDFLKGRLAERAPSEAATGPMYTVYVPDPTGNYNVVVGVEYAAASAAPIGDVLIYVPGGAYVRFVPNGDYRDVAEDVWAQVDDATASGVVTRAYAEEIEVWHGEAVELFLSIAV